MNGRYHHSMTTIVINVIDALPFRDNLWIVKVNENEWKDIGLDEKKRVKTKMPEWWVFVAPTKPIPKEPIICKITRNCIESGEIQNYSHLSPAKEKVDQMVVRNDDIYNKIVLLSLQIFDLEQQRNDLLRQLKAGQHSSQ